jgi:hypothetical protein
VNRRPSAAFRTAALATRETLMRPVTFRLTLRSLALSALVGLGSALPAAAQTGASDAGTFLISVGGRQVGTEEFNIVQTGVGTNSEIVATGRVRVQLPTGTVELTPRLRATGFQATPVSYDVTVGGNSPRRVIATVANGRVSARTLTAAGEQMREYLASPNAIVLDDGIAHQYYFLARRLRNGQVPIIIPRENRQEMATVKGLGEEQVQIGDRTVSLFHLVVTPTGGDERHVWVDALGRVIKVQIPARNYVAVRSEIPA